MANQINELTTTTALAAADAFPIWSALDKDTRKATIAMMTEYVSASLATDLDAIYFSYLTTVAGYKARPSAPIHPNYKFLRDGIWYSPDWIVLVWAGQSNAIGVANSTDGPKTVNPNVFAWNNISAPVVATLGAAPFNTAAGAPNNISFHHAARLEDLYSRPVMIITKPVSGSPIGSWFVGQANWDAFEAQINASLLHPALWGQTTVDVFGFHLGESAHDALQYTLADIFRSFILQCQTRSWSDPDMIFVAGEMLRQEDGGVAYNAIEEWRRAIGGGDIERAFLASSEGLTKNADGTDVHFNGASLAIFGQRYANAPTGARVTEVRADTRDVSETMIWKGQFYTKLTDNTFGPSNVANQNAVVNVIRSGIPVVFEVDGVRTEVLTVTNAATLLVNQASDARLKVWYPAAMLGDMVPAAERPGVTFSNPSGNGTMRRLWVNPNANLRLLFVEGHNLLQHDLNTALLPQSLTGLRFKSVAKLTFNGFKASAMPPALTLLDFSGTTPVPGLVRAAIDAENSARSGAISVTYSGLYASEGFRRLRPEDFGASGLGVVDDGLSMARFTAWGGTLELTPGANYRITAKQVMNLPAGAVIEGNGASITLEYTDTSDGLSFAAGAGAIIQNVVFRFPENAATPGWAHYQERMLGLSTGVKLINCRFIAAVAQPVSADDIRDGMVRILGEDVVIDGCSFYNVYRCIQGTPDASTARSRVSNTRFDNYGKGIDTGGQMSRGVLENLTFGDASAAALTDPGVNAITESSPDLTIRNIRVEGSGEHGIYLAGSIYVSGLVMTDVQVRGSGQCNVKLRRQTDFIIADIHGFDTSDGNAPGTNEDVLRLECCRNGRVIGVSGGEISANGGYKGIYIDACSDIDFIDVLLRGTSSDFIYITDANGPGEASPPTLGNLRFWGVRCFAPGAVPLLNIQATGAVGPIHLDGVDYRNATGSAVITNIGGAATDIVVRGNISTSGTMLTNAAGGGSVRVITNPLYENAKTPFDFGARGSGDDTAAMLAWCAAIQGKVGYLPPATHYKTSAELPITTDGTIILGTGTVEQTTFGYAGFVVDADDCRFEGVRGLNTQTKTLLPSTLATRYMGDPARARAALFYNAGHRNHFENISQTGFICTINNAGPRVWRPNVTIAGATTTTFPLNAADVQADGYYVGSVIRVLGGTDSDFKTVTAYDNATNTVTISDAWTAAQNGSGTYYVIWTERQTGTVLLNIEQENYDFGILGTWLDDFVIDGLISRDGEQTQDAAAPPHAVYITGDAGDSVDPNKGLRSRNVFVDGLHAVKHIGAAFKFRGVDGLLLGDMLAEGCRGIATVEHCTNAVGAGMIGRNLGENSDGRPFGVTVTGGHRIKLGVIDAHFSPDYVKGVAAVNYSPTALLVQSDVDTSGIYAQPQGVTWDDAQAVWEPANAQGLTTYAVLQGKITGATVTPAVIRSRGGRATVRGTGDVIAISFADASFGFASDTYAYTSGGGKTATFASFGSQATSCGALYDPLLNPAGIITNTGTACRTGQPNPSYQQTYTPQGQLSGTGIGMSLGQQGSAAAWGLRGDVFQSLNMSRFRQSGTGSTTLWMGWSNVDSATDWIAINPSGNKIRSGADVNFFNSAGSAMVALLSAGGLRFGASGQPTDTVGTGSPEGVVTAPVGSTFRRTNGGAGTSFYVKESGAGNTGWVAK